MTARSSITGASADAIARSVEEGLEVGRFAEGDALPPVRALAASLAVSPTTVAAAYRLLRQRGFVVGQGRRGTRITRRESRPARLPFPVAAGTVSLADGNPDASLLPDLEALVRELAVPRDLYGGDSITADLAVAGRRLLDQDGLAAEALTVVSGAMDGVERVLASQLRPGDRVAVEDPAFAGVLDLLPTLGLEAVGVAMDDDGMLPSALAGVLERGVEAVIVTPRAHNPTGAAMTRERAAELRRILARFPSMLIVEDDHAAGVAGRELATVGSSSRRHAYLRSVAKSLGPDLRLAFLAGSASVVRRVEARQVVGIRWVSRILQRIVAAALADRGVARTVAAAEKEYARRRSALVAALSGSGIRARGASGLNVWIPVREEAAAVGALAMSGWSVAAGERFRLRAEPGLRVTVARLGGAELDRFAADAAAVLAPRSLGSLA